MAERGYGSVLVLALLFGAVLLMGLAVDIVRLVHEWRRVDHVAAVAAETGAGWVQRELLYEGIVALDELAASNAAVEIVVASGMSVDVAVTTTEVCVAVETAVEPRIGPLLGLVAQHPRVVACASPRQG